MPFEAKRKVLSHSAPPLCTTMPLPPTSATLYASVPDFCSFSKACPPSIVHHANKMLPRIPFPVHHCFQLPLLHPFQGACSKGCTGNLLEAFCKVVGQNSPSGTSANAAYSVVKSGSFRHTGRSTRWWQQWSYWCNLDLAAAPFLSR